MDDPDTWDTLGLWTEITNDVRVAEGITIESGRTDEANQVDAGRCTFRVDNRSGNYSPRNPLGTWFGSLRKNTPVKVMLDRVGDTFNRTVAASSWGSSDNGVSWSVSSGSSVSPATGGVLTVGAAPAASTATPSGAGSWDSDVTMEWSIPAVPVGGGWTTTINLRRQSGTNFMGIQGEVNTDATVDLRLTRYSSTGITNISLVTAALTGYTANRKIWMRGRANGPIFQGKIWYDGSPEPTTWQLEFEETAYQLFYDAEGSSGLLSNEVGIYVLRETSNSNLTSVNIWSYSSVAPLFVGNITEWPVRWDKSANDATVPITASGVLRRLSQGQSPLDSTLFRTISGFGPYAYWPLEDDSGATSAQGIGANVKPATVFGATFGWDGKQVGGAKSTVKVSQDMTIAGRLPTPTGFVATDGWTVAFLLYMTALPPVGQDADVMQISSAGSVATWKIGVTNAGLLYTTALAPDGSVLQNSGNAGAIAAGTWYVVQAEVYQNGANITRFISSISLVTGVQDLTSTSFAATVGLPKSWSLYGSSTSFPDGSVGHVAFFKGHSIFVNSLLYQAAIGYTGETASDRVVRLCGEQGVPIALLGDSTTLMGPQKPATFLDLLREAERSDLGVLFETTYTPGLAYRPRTARYGTLTRLALNFASGHIAEPPEPTDDDQALRNDWTVNRVDGSSARVIDETHVLEQGRYDDSVEISVSTDDVLLDHASMRVFLGTLDELRWPLIEMNLAKNTSLTRFWLSNRVGSRFTIASPPDELPGVTIDLILEGWTQKLTPYGWDVEMNCSPALAWAQFRNVVDGAAGATATDARIDSDTSSLNASITSSATSMVVVRPAGTPIWDTTAPPFDLNLMGERITATAISGTGTTQTFTITRGVNSITKAHTAGETVSLWFPAYTAL
jgi:hypothetical protein